MAVLKYKRKSMKIAKIIILTLATTVFTGCSIIDKSNYATKEEYVLALIKDCQWNADVAEYKKYSSSKAYGAYLEYCNPSNNPDVAYKWGFNVRGRQ